jgi:hypothetical protein
MAQEPTLAQVRDYVLTMLDGLSDLAETVDDRRTRDEIRDFADHLLASWSPAGGGDHAGRTADQPCRQGVEGPPGSSLKIRERPPGARLRCAPED